MEKYRINLEYRGAILSIDELPFGLFLEIEGDEEQITSIASELGYKTDEKILVTYWDLFADYKRENKFSGGKYCLSGRILFKIILKDYRTKIIVYFIW